MSRYARRLLPLHDRQRAVALPGNPVVSCAAGKIDDHLARCVSADDEMCPFEIEMTQDHSGLFLRHLGEGVIRREQHLPHEIHFLRRFSLRRKVYVGEDSSGPVGPQERMGRNLEGKARCRKRC